MKQHVPILILAVLLVGCGGSGYNESTVELDQDGEWLTVRLADCPYVGHALTTEPWTVRVDYHRSVEIIGDFNSEDEAVVAAKNAVLERCDNP